jgi:subtilisin-like proprotein convertase family protein
LLSGDSLLNIAPDPLQDALIDTMPQIVQYAELLETSEQVEEKVSQELDPSDTLNTNIYQPILTLSVGDDDTNDDVGPAQVNDDLTELSNDSDGNIENKTASTAVVDITVEEPVTDNSAVQTDDGSMPIYTNDADLSIEYATSIEIRGPPASETNNTETITSYVEESEVDLTILSDYAAEMQPDGTLELPSLYLVDPTVDFFDGQVIYLDFDGAQAVTYNGPVIVEGINIPVFSADSAGLAGQESVIISQILSTLEQEFDGMGLCFTTSKPESGTSYSTIFIGGDGAEFRDYGFFIGLAEKIDAGNQDPTDNAFVFSENIISDGADLSSVVAVLTNVIAHETRHLIGYAHEIGSIGEGLLDAVADSGDEFGRTDNWDVTDGNTYYYRIYCDAPSGSVITSGANAFRFWVYHSWVRDLRISIISPEGTERVLWDRDGGETDGGYDDDSADDNDVSFNRYNVATWNGETARGYWTLKVSDNATYDEGYISYFYMTLFYMSNSSITVTSPNGGENWERGTPHTIRWNSSNVPENVKIQLYQGTSSSATETIVSSTPNTGSYTWNIPNDGVIGDNFKIRVSSTTHWGTVYDYSNNYFSLNSGFNGQVTVTSPNGGENWERGTPHTVTWTSSGSSENRHLRPQRRS